MTNVICSTPLPWLDLYTGGLARGETTLITGGPKTFKSSLAAMFVMHAAELGVGVTVYTGDRSETAYVHLLSLLASDREALLQLPIRIFEGTPTGYPRAVEEAVEHGSGLLVVDNAHQLAPTMVRRGSRSEELAIVLVDGANTPLEAADRRLAMNATDHSVATVINGPILNVILTGSRSAVIGYDTYDSYFWEADAGWVMTPVARVVSRGVSIPSLERLHHQATPDRIAAVLKDGSKGPVV